MLKDFIKANLFYCYLHPHTPLSLILMFDNGYISFDLFSFLFTQTTSSDYTILCNFTFTFCILKELSHSTYNKEFSAKDNSVKNYREKVVAKQITIDPNKNFAFSFPLSALDMKSANSNFPFNSVDLISKPVKIFLSAEESRVEMSTLFKGKTGIYLWHNNITGDQYIGSGLDLSIMLSRYYFPSYLISPRHITRSILKYGHSAFSVVVLEVCGDTLNMKKEKYIPREQFYINLYKPTLNMNPIAGSSLGFKHTKESKQLIRESRLGKSLSESTKARLSLLFSGPLNPFWGRKHTPETLKFLSENKKGSNHPLFGKPKSAYAPEFIAQQTRDKRGANNPMYGKQKSAETLSKLRHPIFVYSSADKDLVEVSSSFTQTVKNYKMGSDTLSKRLADHKSHKGFIFSRTPIASS